MPPSIASLSPFLMFRIKPIPVLSYPKHWHTCSHCQVGFSSLNRGEWHLDYCTPYLKSLQGSPDSCKSSQFTLVGRENSCNEKQVVDFDHYNALNATNANMENPGVKPKWLQKHLQSWKQRAGDCSVLAHLINRF
jgi:hypothetical protein